jgi:hypothetical protein
VKPLALFVLCLIASVPAARAQPAAALAALKTTPEKTDYHDTSRYADVVAFLEAVDKASPRIHLTTFGKTNEGRSLPLAVAGAPDASPDAVRRTGKLRVYIQGNIHGGEVEGKESAQMLLREIAGGRHDAWLETMVLLVAPIYNADGNERIGIATRGRQNGPLGGQGERPNAQGLDLNRDHMKLDSPEGRAVVKLMNDYDPHVSLDLHTTNGTRHAYFLTYAPPLNPATDPAIIDLLRKDLFPSITKTVSDKYGWDFYYDGNLEGGGRGRGGRGGETGPRPERSWRSFDHRPRFNNNYIGLRNRVALLSEAFAYASFRDRILATSRFVEEALTYVSTHAARIRSIVEDADRRSIVGSKLPLRAELEKSADAVVILMGEMAQEKHPVDGHVMDVRKDVKIPEKMPEYGTFRGTESERVAASYYVPADLKEAIDRLRAHGIAMTPLTTATKVPIEEFRITSSQAAERPFQNHNERTLAGSWEPAERELPAGTLRIDMKQPLARLAFYLVEPRSDDGLVNWNLVDEALKEATVYPIVRSRN